MVCVCVCVKKQCMHNTSLNESLLVKYKCMTEHINGYMYISTCTFTSLTAHNVWINGCVHSYNIH